MWIMSQNYGTYHCRQDPPPSLRTIQFLHICELYSFTDLFCKLHIYTHAVLCGATYHSTVKASKSYILIFVINCCLCMPNQKLLHSVEAFERYRLKCALISSASTYITRTGRSSATKPDINKIIIGFNTNKKIYE